MDHDLELLTVGRISVDLYAAEVGAGWDEVASFTKAVGGSATNVAVAAARLGHRAAVLTKVGADPFGGYLRRRLAEFGVDTRYVGTSQDLRTPLAFAVLDPPEDPQLLFYREPTAPDLTIEPGDVEEDVIRDVGVLWVTGTGMSAEPSAGCTARMLEVRGRRRHTVVDLDYRPTLWESEDAARKRIGSLIPQATVAVGNRAECEIAVGSSEPDEAADRLLEAGVEWAVVKMGGEGVLVATEHSRSIVPPRPVRVVCGLGAGDAFGGALVHGLLAGWDPVTTVRFANAAGALVASRLLCADAMGTEAEISALLQE
ncbi:MAG: 5-dehydro-2-deoxygluconokinase [Actinomycetota bacterium]|nr:5-dehydro-2-deoxygluconokinase [Actinomycetota bacterium]